MPKYNVHLVAVASTTVTVEADDETHAIDVAYDQGLPYAGALDGYDLGEWVSPSDLFPDTCKTEHDVEEA